MRVFVPSDGRRKVPVKPDGGPSKGILLKVSFCSSLTYLGTQERVTTVFTVIYAVLVVGDIE